MTLTLEQRRQRVKARRDELRYWLERQQIVLNRWSFDGEAISVGDSWPVHSGVRRLSHPEVTVPDTWQIADTRLDLNLGGEGLVRLEYANGELDQLGLDAFHRRFRLSDRAFRISVDAVARLPFGVPNRDPRLTDARLVWIEAGLDRLVRVLQLVLETSRALQNRDIGTTLIGAAESSLDLLEWPSNTDAYLARVRDSPNMQSIWELPAIDARNGRELTGDERASVLRALEALSGNLHAMRERYPQSGAIALSGHAHIDLAWLWPMDETQRKAQRTFSTVTAMMDRYPELIFNQSTAQLYSFIEQDDPALFGALRERVNRGQWEPIGGMWVEPDTNMAAGESLARQLLYGQRYFRKHFGWYHTVCWLPDVFGFTPALPQLLKLARIDNFFTIKLTWSETNEFPHDLFWWEGIDGTRVLAHMFNNPGGEDTDTNGYNADPGPDALIETWKHFRGKHIFPESLLSVGYGDGGGSVTAEMLERAREMQHFPGVPASHFTRVTDYFERVRSTVDPDSLPVWVGELYLELHRGTLTSQGPTKLAHRQAETGLVAAETITSLYHLLGGPRPESLETLWRLLLRNEFHDILPGSGIREVNAQAVEELSQVIDETAAMTRTAVEQIAATVSPPGDKLGLFVLNPTFSARPVRASFNQDVPGAQRVEDGFVATGGTLVPGLGSTTLISMSGAVALSVAPGCLENSYLRVELDADGTLTRLFDKRVSREVLAGPANALWAYVDKPPTWDAWDIDADYARVAQPFRTIDAPRVVEEGPHRVAVRVVKGFRDSTITQDIRLWSNSPRLDFVTIINWHDRRWLVKARFPVAIRAGTASFETAFGLHQRPTHRNTSWDEARFEVAAHRFVDLSEPGYGLALLNNGKYGHSVIGNELSLSLLRSPIFPDPLSDEGTQSFTYSLLPHPGNLHDSDVLMEAEDLNSPLQACVVRAAGPSSWQPFELAGLQAGLGCLKPSEDGDSLLMRLYEPFGARGEIRVAPPAGWVFDVEVNILEEELGPVERRFAPFQIRSWRLRREIKDRF